MRRNLILLAVAGALALGVWLALRTGEDAAGPREVAPGAPAADGTPAGVAAAPAPPAEPTRVPVPRAEPPRPPRAPATTNVRVVDGATGQPLAGAEVAWLEVALETDAERRLGDAERLDPASRCRRFGTLVHADEAGRVRLPAPRNELWVAARAGELSTVLRRSAGEALPATLALERRRELCVRVRDEGGRPVADVPVALRRRFFALSVDLRRATSGADGVARLGLVDEVARAWGTEYLSAALALPLARPAAVALGPSDFEGDSGGGVHELVLPPTVPLELTVEDADGRAPELPLLVELARAPAALDEAGPEPLVALVTEGRARFPHVGLGVELELRVRAASGADDPPLVSARVTSPGAPGAPLRHALRLPRLPPCLELAVTRPGGAPLASRRVDAELWTEGLRPHARDGRTEPFHVESLGLRTAADGRLCVPDRGRSPDVRRALVVRWRDAEAGDELAARVELPPISAGDAPDLGTVELGPPPVLAAGRVTDEDGRPVAGASVVAARDAWFRYDPLLEVTAPAWDRRRTRSDGEGRFAVHGWSVAGAGRAIAEHGDFALDATATFELGAGDVELVLRRGATVRGRVATDDGIDATALEVRATSSDSSALYAEPALEHVAAVGPAGGFALEGLVPWTYDVEVLAPPVTAPVAFVGGVVVRANGFRGDERLDPIDLRGRLFAARLAVVDEAGAPLPAAEVEWLPFAGAPLAASAAVEGGVLELVLAEALEGVVVRARGRRPVEVGRLASDATVTLVRGPRIRLALPADAPRLREGHRYAAYLGAHRRPARVRSTRPAPEVVPFDERGTAAVHVDEPGTYWVQLAVLREGAPPVTLQGVHQSIEVLDAAGEQRFDVELSGEAFDPSLTAGGGSD